tara:strand:+ start:664 stop:834 length:171 start_codon:yes stop_codon:yes gene_type:complete
MIAVLAEIRETLNNLILKAPQEWHTQVALPFVKIVGTVRYLPMPHAHALHCTFPEQ